MRNVVAVLVLIVFVGCGEEDVASAPEEEYLGAIRYGLNNVMGEQVPASAGTIQCSGGGSASLQVDTAIFRLSFATPDSSRGEALLLMPGTEIGCRGRREDVEVSASGTWHKVAVDSIALTWLQGAGRFTRLEVNTNDEHFVPASGFLAGDIEWDFPISSVSAPETTVIAFAAFHPEP